jgi:DNA polymerase-3 subunit gamma/tau
MVFYRKYRPQLINDLDNALVRETLLSVLKSSSQHAFLFTGPKGLGKTSTARIIAKVVNCEKRKKDDVEPCNKCDQCVSITNGTNLDVLEIDAASNRGIDEIRELKEKIRLSPSSASKKVYIIDEVHMLTTEAFNALLKTLEEPPSHAMFILCTTEQHKVPATIVSRCMHINFSFATDDEIVRSLKRVSSGEKLKIDDDALYAIAKMADGGFRDATKILEELVALADGKKIAKELIEEKYQVSSIMYLVFGILGALSKRQVKEALGIVSELVKKGVDIKHFLSKNIEVLHEVLLSQMGIQNTKYDIPASPASTRGVPRGEQNTKFSTDEIKILFEIFSKAYADMKYAVLPQLPLELAIIEYCESFNQEKSIAEVNEELPQKKVEDNGVTVSSLRKQVGTIKKVQALYGTPKPDVSIDEPTIKTSTVELMHASPNGEVTNEWLDHFWKNIISEIKNYNHTTSGVLRGCSIKSYNKKTLVIETIYKFHKERLDEIKTREALGKVCKLLTGKDVEVKVELKGVS